ncbi:CGNR zinc finger domain-containing protein [Amycolatopsis azurea]|uniref:CGNR zinc finger domain-containing protein n=1 Tax=Amycolatopsis azurea TaxID=36819 RepID=UPI00380A91D3
MVEDLTALAVKADELPGGEPVLDRARARGRRAVEIAAGAVEIDPTLLQESSGRGWGLEILAELLRQLRPLARQAALALEHARLIDAGAPPESFRRIGRINPLAPDELDALSERAVEIAEGLAAKALPDWNTPRRIRERSQRLLPEPAFLAELADQLRRAVRPALELDYPAPAATRLAALADQLHAAGEDQPKACAAPGCGRGLRPATTGRPRTYCGPACRQRAHRARTSNSVRIDR